MIYALIPTIFVVMLILIGCGAWGSVQMVDEDQIEEKYGGSRVDLSNTSADDANIRYLNNLAAKCDGNIVRSMQKITERKPMSKQMSEDEKWVRERCRLANDLLEMACFAETWSDARQRIEVASALAASQAGPGDPSCENSARPADAQKVSLPKLDVTHEDHTAGVEYRFRGECADVHAMEPHTAVVIESNKLMCRERQLRASPTREAELRADLQRGLNVEFQRTICCVCAIYKHTPIRNDNLGGYVCGGCLEKAYEDSEVRAEAAEASLAAQGEMLKEVTAERDELLYHTRHGSPDDVA